MSEIISVVLNTNNITMIYKTTFFLKLALKRLKLEDVFVVCWFAETSNSSEEDAWLQIWK